MLVRLVVRLAPLLVITAGAWAQAQETARPPTLPHLEHVAVWAADVDKTAAFLNDTLGWRRHPLEFGVAKDSTVFGGMKLAFVDANGFWLELVQPTSEGPGMEFLKQKGKGSLVELDFFVDDFEKTVARLKSKGVEPAGMDDKPMQGGGLLTEWARIGGKTVSAGERLAYVPLSVSGGTSIELGWEYPTGVVLYRDKTWGDKEKTPASAPRTDHVTVATADLAKSTDMYVKVLDLRHTEGVSGIARDWMGVTASSQVWLNGNSHVWIDLVKPTGAAGEKLLQDPKLGSGSIVELGVEVKDLDAFVAAMKAKGILMTAGEGVSLPPGAASVTAPTGDRYCYFPRDKSEGMRIMVFQRAQSGSGALASTRPG